MVHKLFNSEVFESDDDDWRKDLINHLTFVNHLLESRHKFSEIDVLCSQENGLKIIILELKEIHKLSKILPFLMNR